MQQESSCGRFERVVQFTILRRLPKTACMSVRRTDGACAGKRGTGRRLWSYHAAPQSRWISVYGKLMSTWPVAGGVVVQDGVVYAAAGIAHYDGTYVVALDAVTGEVKCKNDSSGVVSDEVDSGISLQGNLMIEAGELRFLGGNVYETARFDLATLRCLNTPHTEANAQFRTAFYPYYPTYGKYVSLDAFDAEWVLAVP